MKVFISADIEGVTGIANWDEANLYKSDNAYFREQMTAEVLAACEGAVEAGAKDILVKDAHATARNIIPTKFPQCVRFSRGWSGHPFSMMDEIDSTFDAAMMIGYHSRAGSLGSPLAHTMSSSVIGLMKINGEPVSEFHLNTMTAMSVNVPMVFLAGDEVLCQDVKHFNEKIEVVATQRGKGFSTISVHPEVTKKAIREGARRALGRDLKNFNPPLEKRFKLEIEYKTPPTAYGKSFYPGARLEDERRVILETVDYFDVLRFIHFAL